MTLFSVIALAAGPCLAPQDSIAPAPPVQPAPREMEWEDFLGSGFRTDLLLPTPVGADLGSGSKAVSDLAADLQRLAALEFDIDGDPAVNGWTASFGNLMQEFAAVRRSRQATDRLLAQLERQHREIYDQVAAWLPELVRSDLLYGRRWKPGKPTERDGILDAAAWHVRPLEGRSKFWRELDADTYVNQTAVFIYADYAAIKTVENDYARYDRHVGRELEWIRPVRGSHVVSPAGAEARFASLRIRFEAQAPFLFPNVLGDMRILERRNGAGLLTTEIYTLPGDFHWFAGRDTYIPVRTTSGKFVGTLVANQTGMDVSGAPDGNSDRRKAVRASLGNKKRLVEPAFESLEDWQETPAGVVPVIPVTGYR